MLVVMKPQATPEEIQAVCQHIEKLGFRAHPLPGSERTAIGITGKEGEIGAGTLEELQGVQELIRVSKPYKLVSRDVKQDNTVIRFPGTRRDFGGPGFALIAGPCGMETRAASFRGCRSRSARAGAQFFRGGAYKPRTSPYALSRVWEKKGLQIMAEIRETFGLTHRHRSDR